MPKGKLPDGQAFINCLMMTQEKEGGEPLFFGLRRFRGGMLMQSICKLVYVIYPLG